MKKILSLLGGIGIVTLFTASYTFAYTQEEVEAYEWAYMYGITTQPTIEAANLDGNITRQAFAKMVVNYLENVSGVEQAVSNSCSFPDEGKITNDLVPYAKKTCSYGIMGKDGTKFNPTQPLDKAQLGTVLSRILWGDEYNNDGKGYYIYHLNALKQSEIMDNIDNPQSFVRRGDVLIMLKRAYETFGPYVHMNGTSIFPYGNTIKSVNEYMDDYMIEDGEHIVYYDSGAVAVKMNYKNGQRDGEWIAYYENGQIQKKNFYKSGEMDGEQLEYYENGQLMSKENYKDGELDGEVVAYYENGQLWAKGYFKNGELDGEVVAYYENGQLGNKLNYKDGVANGEMLEYYENGKLKSKENYKDGLEDGEQLEYYENGKLKAKSNYKDGLEDGEQLEYYENGQLMSKEIYKDGREDGSWTYYYENGQLGTKISFKDGRENGEVIDYYENGKLKDKGYFKDGEPNGEFVAYYENGQLKEKANYKNGGIDGEIIAYYESGKLKGKGNYKDGKEDGKLIYYYEDGQVSLEINFKDGIFDGKYTRRFEDGKITEMNYKNGKQDGKQVGYYEDGSVRFLHNFKDGFGTKSFFDKKGNVIGTGTEMFTDEMEEDGGLYKSILNGLEITYHLNGQTRDISYYKDGELDGTQTLYYENGQIESICNYVNGITSGDCTMYDEDGKEITRYSDDNYGPNILPDSAEISVKDPIIVGEAVDLSVTMMKNGSKMSDYKGTIRIIVTDEDGTPLRGNEYTLPGYGIYEFLDSDLGSKLFQRGLTINKEGKFYIEVQDLNEYEDVTLGKQLVTVVKK